MINRNVLNAMNLDELKNYICHLEKTIAEQGKLNGAEIELRRAYDDVVNAIKYRTDAWYSFDEEKNTLRKLTIELEEKYKDLIPKPILTDDTIPY